MLRRRTPTLVLNVNASKKSIKCKLPPYVERGGLGGVGCSGTGDVAALGLHGCACAEEVGVTVSCAQLVCAQIREVCGDGLDSPSSSLVTLGQNFFSLRYGRGYAASSLVYERSQLPTMRSCWL